MNRYPFCPKCHQEQPEGSEQCERCGLVFDKYRPDLAHRRPPRRSTTGSPVATTSVRALLFRLRPGSNPIAWGGRTCLYALLFVWGWFFIVSPLEDSYAGRSFLHLVNLPFHEFGHLFFMPLGRWISTLGGTLGQLLVPLLCLVAFLLKTRDPFAASVALWWLGESAIDVAPYINDARAGELVLLGGVTGREMPDYHDWEVILGTIGMLRFDHALARLAQVLGIALMLLSFAWGGYVLHLEYRNRDRPGGPQHTFGPDP